MKRMILTPQEKLRVAQDKNEFVGTMAGQLTDFLTTTEKYMRVVSMPSLSVQGAYLSVARLSVGDYVEFVLRDYPGRFEHLRLQVVGAYSVALPPKVGGFNLSARSINAQLFVRVEIDIPDIPRTVRSIPADMLQRKNIWRLPT